jgi:flagellar secretion chaperone FliS
MNPYRTRSIEALSGVELTIALYDGIVRFLHQAIAAVKNEDADSRRAAVKRAFDILMYLQATLRTDVGGKPAEALGEFYVAMFALILQGSQQASEEKFRKAIDCVMNVRGAWRQVVNDPAVTGATSHPTPVSMLPTGLDQTPDSAPRADWLA